MGSVGRGVRVGAAAFVVGVSLAGPQAVSVAWAESGDTDAGSVSAGPAAGEPSAPGASDGASAAGRCARSRGPRYGTP